MDLRAADGARTGSEEISRIDGEECPLESRSKGRSRQEQERMRRQVQIS